jgi:hypothetical protein
LLNCLIFKKLPITITTISATYLQNVLTLAQDGLDIVWTRIQAQMAQGCLMLFRFIE